MAFHEDLKSYRLKQNITLEEISDRTKININTLKAFEEGDFSSLPTTYVRLFLKAYAKEIGMTEEEVLRNYENEVQFAGQSESQARKESARRAEEPSSNAKPKSDASGQRILLNSPNQPATKKIIVSAIILILIIVFGKLAMRPSDEPEKQPPAVIAPPALSLFEKSDSLSWGLSGLLSDSNAVEVGASLPVTLYIKRDSLPTDTVLVDSGQVYLNSFVKRLDIFAYPSNGAAFVLMDQPLQPFNPANSWTQLKVRGAESILYSYSLK
ncbi:MAG: helix-turn-helix domain-containing protein [Candidatus Marinimicrobia bacterium]|nr:helix-turn-helix domain-containing protein [Candidatus Neomarinimicrobiota bacterium]MCF7839305.1 helix-turn-helix domain-containing protein [Candidatus Neomarinimicrobiota bacterium]MCF7902120.1 helix-turn-helix domain-containing protein [Candidatus Neomarinimicrobiota bacterium]